MFLAVFPFFAGGLLGGVVQYLVLTPAAVVRSFQIWQLGTYLFINPGVLGFVFNMLALWMFGRELEGIWGTETVPPILLPMRVRRGSIRGSGGLCLRRLGRRSRGVHWRNLRNPCRFSSAVA